MTGRSRHNDALHQAFLDAWQEHGTLIFQRCAVCSAIIFYPRSACPACWSPNVQFETSRGHGEVRTFTLIHRGLAPEYQAQAPVVLAEIGLEEGFSMIARVVGMDPTGIKIGDRVRTVGPPGHAAFVLPTFELDASFPWTPHHADIRKV